MDVEQYFNNKKETVLIDVRTPAEYQKGHIPEAINLPLFTDEERIVVGTSYKQESPDDALLIGLDIVGPKMRQIIEQTKEIAQDRNIVVHCWRGGKRSGSVAWLLKLAGLNVQTIEGGYKAYRQWVQYNLGNLPHQMLLLSGYTGSRKTEILLDLREKGEQVIDLEGLANHKGSVFGGMGQPKQPSIEQFENNLWEEIQQFNPDIPIWIEGESKSIGGVYMCNGFWEKICTISELEIRVPKDIRVAHLVDAYGHFPIENLKIGFDKILKRLGGQHHKKALEALDNGRIDEAAAISLSYYDKAYDHSRKKHIRPEMHRLELPQALISEAAEHILNFAKENFKQTQWTK